MMKVLKRMMGVLLVLAACVTILPMAQAENVETIASGGHMYYDWMLTSDGVLAFDDVYQISSVVCGSAPWYPYREQIKKIRIHPQNNTGITIGDYAFCDLTSLQSVELYRGGVNEIGTHAFENCISLEKIYLWGCSDLDIADKAFYNCSSLEEISLPSGCNLGKNVFGQCRNLNVIFITNTDDWGNGKNYYCRFDADETAFSGVSATVYYPETLKHRTNNYGGTLTWCGISYGVCGTDARWIFDKGTGTLTISGTGDIQRLPFGGQQPWYCFCDDIKKVVVETGITEIPDYCFEYLQNITTCEIPNTVCSMSANALNACSSLNNLLIPSSVQEFWHNSWFTRCETLTDIYYFGTADEWKSIENSDVVITGSGAISVPITVHCLELNENPATCTESGVEPYYRFDDYGEECAYPFTYDQEKEIISSPIEAPATGHSGTWITTKAASCNSEGEQKRTCSICGVIETEVLPAVGHNLIELPAIAPTCSVAGLTEGKQCSVCGEVTVEQEITPATGHSWFGNICSVCGASAIKIWSGVVATTFAGGNGTEDDPYQINNGGQLARLNQIDTTGLYFIQTADICLNDTTNWESWGSKTPVNIWAPISDFRGHYDGQNHTVFGVCVKNNLSAAMIGLFSTVHKDSSVQNVNVVASYFYGHGDNQSIGGVVSSNDGIVVNCSNGGMVISGSGDNQSVGGVVGCSSGIIKNSSNNGTVSCGSYADHPKVGGVVGSNSGGTVTDCFNSGAVSSKGYGPWIGGIVGSNTTKGIVENNFNIGVVSGHNYGNSPANSAYIGGVVGYNLSTLKNCFNAGTITCSGEVCYRRGVVGYNNGTVTDCYYLDSCGATGTGHYMTETQLISGWAAYLLGEAWGQNINNGQTNQGHPVLNGARVYLNKDDEFTNYLHTPVIDVAKPPTCTEDGFTEGSHCADCGEVLVAQEVIPALGHTEVVDEAVKPTCTETGLTEGRHCSACDEVLTAQQEIPANGHTEVIDAAALPTCTRTGLTEGKHCSICGEVTVAQQTVPELGHRYEDPAFIWADDFSSVSAAMECNSCDHTETGETGDISWVTGQCKLTAFAAVVMSGKAYTARIEIVAAISGNEIMVTLPDNVRNMVIFAASYSDNGAFCTCASAPVIDGTATLSISGSNAKLFFLSTNGYRPLTPYMAIKK